MITAGVVLLLAAQDPVGVPRPSGPPGTADDSVYASAALGALVHAVANRNALVPSSIAAYTARVETELSAVSRVAGGREGAFQVEQIASTVRWERGGPFEQRVVGHRARMIGINVSFLSFLRQPWAIPHLYGNRIRVAAGGDSATPRHGRRPPMIAIHPFAADRARVYHFTGGDTVAVVRRAGGTAIHIVRIRIEPRTPPPEQMLLFSGLADIDAEREQIVRLRGRFLLAGVRPTLLRRVTALSLEGVVFAELENAEVDGRYWLPSYQRIEFQATSSLATESRTALRMVSRFGGYAITAIDEIAGSGPVTVPVGEGLVEALVGDTTGPARRRLIFAPRDSESRYDDWERELGRETAETRTTDFDDVGPDRLRPTGVPYIDWRSRRLSDVARFNRVEGAFTGIAGSLALRDALCGATLYAAAGRAWREGTFKGGGSVELVRGRWTGTLAAERALATTNDFRPLFDAGASLGALLFTEDDYDYVDRQRVTASLAHVLSGAGSATIRLEAGFGSDDGEWRRVTRGLIRRDSSFRENRGLDRGRYAREALTLEWSPTVSGEYLEAGVGGRLAYEHGHGGLGWQRLEGELASRRSWGPFSAAMRSNAGALLGAGRPPQQLFELGSGEGLSGYEYKEFGGDRAARVDGALRYGLPFWRAPAKIWRFYFPGPSPALSLGATAGWTEASNAATRAALLRLGMRTDWTGRPITDSITGQVIPVSRPTERVRATVAAQLVVFGGFAMGLGRAVDHPDSWRLVVGRY